MRLVIVGGARVRVPRNINMLGLLRFALAVCVVIAHLTEIAFFSHWGVFAVFGFYLVSGYLMTLILHEIYFFQFPAFALNRFLRLYPIYFVVAIASLGLIFVNPSASAGFHPMWQVRYQVVDWLGNALIIPLGIYPSKFCLIPTIWSVAAELIDYFLLWLIVCQSPSKIFHLSPFNIFQVRKYGY